MDTIININPVGVIKSGDGTFRIELAKKYIPALTNIYGFSHLQITWWGHLFDNRQQRDILVVQKPYKKGPEKTGIFATHSPMRPNPLLITTIFVQYIDFNAGIIYTPYIDAEDGSPVLDIKPYHMCDRIRDCSVPEWCQHWPQWYEESAEFDWEAEFNYEK